MCSTLGLFATGCHKYVIRFTYEHHHWATIRARTTLRATVLALAKHLFSTTQWCMWTFGQGRTKGDVVGGDVPCTSSFVGIEKSLLVRAKCHPETLDPEEHHPSGPASLSWQTPCPPSPLPKR